MTTVAVGFWGAFFGSVALMLAGSLMAVVDALMREGSIAPAELAAMLDLPATPAGEPTDAYAALLATFRARKADLLHAAPDRGGGAGLAASAARVLRAMA